MQEAQPLGKAGGAVAGRDWGEVGIGMRVLVTGGAGFIGSAVCRLLVGEFDPPVLNVEKLTYAANWTSLRRVEGRPRDAARRAGICERNATTAVLRSIGSEAVRLTAAESNL